MVSAYCLSYLSKIIRLKKFPEILKGFSHHSAPVIKPTLIFWHKPEAGWIKVNTDDSFNYPDAGMGGIFRDWQVHCILYFSAPTIAQDALETEAIAVYWALFIAKQCQLNRVIVESDSQLLLDIISQKHSCPWHVIKWIMKIQQLSNTLYTRFLFIHREGNRPAHWLARTVLNFDFPVISSIVPSNLSFLLESDLLGLPFLRVL